MVNKLLWRYVWSNTWYFGDWSVDLIILWPVIVLEFAINNCLFIAFRWSVCVTVYYDLLHVWRRWCLLKGNNCRQRGRRDELALPRRSWGHYLTEALGGSRRGKIVAPRLKWVDPSADLIMLLVCQVWNICLTLIQNYISNMIMTLWTIKDLMSQAAVLQNVHSFVSLFPMGFNQTLVDL